MLVRDTDFDPAQCVLKPTGAVDALDGQSNGNGDMLVECPEEFQGRAFSEFSSDAAQAACELTEGCMFSESGRLYGKFGRGMNKDELIELIRESWRVLGVIGLVIIGILWVAVMGSRYVGRNVGGRKASGEDGEGGQGVEGEMSAEQALENSRAEAIEKENEKAKQMVADAHRATCSACEGTGWVKDKESEKVLEEVDAHIDKVEDKELEQAGVDVAKRTEIKLSKKEQKKADAVAKKAAIAEAKAERVRVKQEKKAAKRKTATQISADEADPPPPPLPTEDPDPPPPPLPPPRCSTCGQLLPSSGDDSLADAPPAPADFGADIDFATLKAFMADPDAESLEQMAPLKEVDEPNPMLFAPSDAEEFDMESTTNLTAIGEKAPMTKKEQKAAEKAAKKAEKEAKKAAKKGKVMEKEFDSPKTADLRNAENPLADTALE